MTSYANNATNETANDAQHNATSTTAAGTTVGVAGVNDEHAVYAPLHASNTTALSQISSPSSSLPSTLPKKLLTTNTSPTLSSSQDDYDYDSLSDGREKADTTPENIKKIDDVMETTAAGVATATAEPTATHYRQQQQHNSFMPASPRRALMEANNIGLAAAIDDSNAKFCLAKPAALLCSSEKDTFCKSEQHIESGSNNNITPPISPFAKNNNNNNSNYNANETTTTTALDAKHDDDDDSSASNTTTTNKQSFAFTIDHFNDKDCDPAATAAKYKNMMERFQSRHRRGASMSKLESSMQDSNKSGVKDGTTTSTLTSSMSAMPLTTQRNARNATTTTTATSGNSNDATDGFDTATAMPKVKLRVRDRSTSRVRDAAKRHSWSPRSSTQEMSQATSNLEHHTTATTTTTKIGTPTTHKANINASISNATAANRKTAVVKTKPPPLQMPKGAANLMANRTQFTPRSIAMQLALQKVDFLCPQPPLADFKHLNMESGGDNVSEAGTYTLDGDNYTEEQKDLMNIDKSLRMRHEKLQRAARPKDLQLHAVCSSVEETSKIPVHINNTRSANSNVLEVNYYHDAEEQQQQQPRSPHQKTANDLLLGNHQSAGAYLEKIKSRVLRNMCATKSGAVAEMSESSSKQLKQTPSTEERDDVGCFTSVTTSGVLAKQSALDPRPKLTRRSSLSTSQIDSSEYISNEAKLKNSNAASYAGGGFTDHQKAEYRLNVFTNQKDSQKFAATRNLIESPPDSPSHKLSDAAVLKTAQTKNDWIQEWARNARARSLANECGGGGSVKHRNANHQPELMTRSYTCASDTCAVGGGAGTESLTDDSIYSKQCAAKLNKTLAERYRLAGDCDFSSDPSLTTSYAKSTNTEVVCKPPKSPTKIPSPLHSLGRARSASRTRASLQNILAHQADGDGELVDDDDDDNDIYLQKTAAAINNLQQSLSRKNSLKSPTHSASPRAHSARTHATAAFYSPPECSPQHSLDSTTVSGAGGIYQRSPRQRRNLPHDVYARQQHQLMTSSFNEQQLQLLTSGEYLARQMRARKNSFDGNINNSPGRRTQAQVATVKSPQSGDESPLRRSTSYSAKIATHRAARPQFQNIYTPPAARHNYTLAVRAAAEAGDQSALAIKKSASSNNFRQAYSDYDENLQYYINDEDELVDEYYSSGAEEDYLDDSYYQDESVTANEQENSSSVPLSNTRYNKALLMRIERSKQKVAGSKVSSAPATGKSAAAAAAITAAGVVACPNTPELPRRNIKSAPRAGAARQSMPRDTSLSRLANAVPNSLASAKKQILQTAAAVPTSAAIKTTATSNQRVQPKYLDISKYKPAQGNTFLRKNDAKSTLKTPADAMKRSPSSSSMGLTRADPTRISNRSVRSVASCMTTSLTSVGSGRASSAARRDASVTKQKEAEMAMWKRRSTYDPMKAAAEDRRKKEEAKRLAVVKNTGEVPFESATLTRNNQPTYCQQSSLEETEWTLGETENGEDDCF